MCYHTHFEITGGPCSLIGPNWCNLFTNHTIFCLKSHLFSANETTLKTKQPIRFQGLFKVTNQIAGKWKTKSISCGKFCNFCFQNSYPPPPQKKKWMNLISNQLSTTSIKYFNWPNPVFGQFQNGCNKVEIEPCVVQFWSEIILVIWNGTDFEIAHTYVLFQPKLHFTQFNYHNKCYIMLKISRPTVILNTKFNKFDTCGVCSIAYEWDKNVLLNFHHTWIMSV